MCRDFEFWTERRQFSKLARCAIVKSFRSSQGNCEVIISFGFYSTLLELRSWKNFKSSPKAKRGGSLKGLKIEQLSLQRQHITVKNPLVRTQWFKNLLAEICHFNTPKYKNLAKQDQADSYMWATVKYDKHLNRSRPSVTLIANFYYKKMHNTVVSKYCLKKL